MNNKIFEWAGVMNIGSYEYWYRVFWFLLITYICNLNWNLGL